MKALLICPAERDGVAALAETMPLSNVPVLGKGVVEYWLEHLATLGAKEVFVLATDRPHRVRAVVGDGSRWGLRVDVLPEIRELSPDEARKKYRAPDEEGWMAAPNDVVLMDHLPELPGFPLFTSHADWCAALEAWMPHAASPARIGVREVQPGVWVGLHSRVARDAELRAPCWIGEGARVGPGAVVGPMAVVENNAFIERGAEVSHSVIGPETFVGEFTEVKDSIAMGSTLVSCRIGSCIKVSDPFLLSSLYQRRSAFARAGVPSRVAAALTMLLLLPLALLAMAKSRLRGRPMFRPLLAVRPRSVTTMAVPGDTLVYYELTGVNGWLRRWPQLWKIVRGEFAWTGNRPLHPIQAASLSNDFERLWLAAPLGLISLADAEACSGFFTDEARAHASYYAARANWRLDWSIFTRALFRFTFGVPYRWAHAHLAPLLHPARLEERKAD